MKRREVIRKGIEEREVLTTFNQVVKNGMGSDYGRENSRGENSRRENSRRENSRGESVDERERENSRRESEQRECVDDERERESVDERERESVDERERECDKNNKIKKRVKVILLFKTNGPEFVNLVLYCRRFGIKLLVVPEMVMNEMVVPEGMIPEMVIPEGMETGPDNGEGNKALFKGRSPPIYLLGFLEGTEVYDAFVRDRDSCERDREMDCDRDNEKDRESCKRDRDRKELVKNKLRNLNL